MTGEKMTVPNTITVTKTFHSFKAEPLIRPFGFKGGHLTEIGQTIVRIESANNHGGGWGTQNVLWSDASVFAAHSEKESSKMMDDVSRFALHLLEGRTFQTPLLLLQEIFGEVHDYACRITGRANLRKTFTLNALVPVDNALWVLYYRENKCHSFDELIPDSCRAALSHRNRRVAAIPLISYNVPVAEIQNVVAHGYFVMKIKIGQPGTQEEMLAKDMARLTEIQETIGSMRTPHTTDGRLPWYFDANGRYEKKETLVRLLEHAKKIGMMDQIAIVEEPFPEEADIRVDDLPVCLAADESAHTPEDAIERMDRGYKAIALKPAAKTLSMSMLMAKAAYQRNVPCFCADLTVHPILVDWNKNIAARLAPFPGMGTGLLESNGNQNYLHWDEMCKDLPNPNASWVQQKDGLFQTEDDFFQQGGGIFDDSPQYKF